ncbi:MAG: efflux transporter outer membrane subunit [Betaproteobacteria bacterium]|nr:efflux transporter outer membrane subunit [Betaproteobacteria bacterium]
MTLIRPLARALACLAGILAAAGCAVGPDFRRPEPPKVERYTREPLPSKTAATDTAGGEAQALVVERDLPADWWTLFGSRQLSELVERALKANPNVQQAEAALRQAQELVRAQQGFFFPTVTGNYARTRAKDSGTLSPALASADSPYTLHTAQLAVAYSPDVFGGLRRQVESLQGQAEAQRFQLEAAYLSLASNVVAAAVQEASLRAQVAAARDIVAALGKSLEILRRQLAVGFVAGIDVAAQESALAQAEQAVPPLLKQLEQTRNQLAVLTGRFPAENAGEVFELADLHLPVELPVSLPSRLVEQRPDVRAAEALLHSASADIGVATANMLPQFTINATYGGVATNFSQMFANGNPFWTVAVGASQTIFAGGTLLARKRAAEAAYDAAAAQYRATVLAAFQNVADALYALQADAEALSAAVKSEQAARRTLDLVIKQLQVGQVNYLALLTAQQAYQQAVINLAQARAARYADTAALFQALGGGWWNRTEAAQKALSANP